MKYGVAKIFYINVVLTLTVIAVPNPVEAQPGMAGGSQGQVQPRLDKWEIMGSGGGGAMFYPAISPHDSSVAFVGCDMTGSYVTYDGGASWRMFNLRGRVRFFVFDPLDANTVYANGLGLFKSSDLGRTWSLLYPDTAEITGIVCKGDHAEELFVTSDSTTRDVVAFAIDPADSKRLFAVIEINKATAFYTSPDGGAHWKKERELAAGAKDIFVDPASDPTNRAVYITGEHGVLERKRNSWKQFSAPAGVKTLTSFSAGFDVQRRKMLLYAVSGKSYFNPARDASGIFFSEDGGATWENREKGLLSLGIKDGRLPEWRTIATSALHPNVVYLSYNGLEIGRDSLAIGVAKSTDAGKTWQLAWKDVYARGGAMATPNMAPDWLNARFGFGFGENPFSIGVSPNDPETVYTTDFGRTIKTTDGGTNWQQVYSKQVDGAWRSRGLDVTTGYCVVYDPADSNHMFIAKTDIGLLESRNAGVSWNSATMKNGVPHEWENTTYWLTFDPSRKDRAWAVMSGTHDLPRPKMFRRKTTAGFKGGVLLSENGGKTWTPVSTSIGEAAMTHILLDPTSNVASRTLYACAFGKGVYKSVDGGKTWVRKNKGLQGEEPFAWQIVRRETDGNLFLIVSRRSEGPSTGGAGDGALYRSSDGAESWTRITLPRGTNGPTGLAIDEQNPARLILTAWGRELPGVFTPDAGGGIFASDNNGTTWKSVLEADQHVSSVVFDKRTGRFYACGFEGSAWYSEDGGNNWTRIRGFNFKWANRVGLDERDPEKIYIITFGGGVWHGPAKGDPDAVEDIISPRR